MASKISDLFGRVVFEGTVSDGEIRNINVNRQEHTMCVYAIYSQLVSPQEISRAEAAICKMLSLSVVRIVPIFPHDALNVKYLGWLSDSLRAEISKVNGFLDDAEYEFENGVLSVMLKYGGKEFIEKSDFPQVLKQRVRDSFGTEITVEFFGVTDVTSLSEEYLKMRREADEAGAPIETEDGTVFSSTASLETQHRETDNAEISECEAPELIFGEMIEQSPVDISRIYAGGVSGEFAIEGEAFSVVANPIRNGAMIIFTFCLWDGTSSIMCKKLLYPKNFDLEKKVKPGQRYRLFGKMEHDDYAKQEVFVLKSVVRVPKAGSTDTAEKKRVELHLHTTMSALDALTPVKDAVRTAFRWGHRAIAITDHGVVQSFPDALHEYEAIMKANPDADFKVLYGVEGYFLNDVDDKLTVQGDTDALLNDQYVAFDIETTGLDPFKDRIIEIGAVLFTNGIEEARFQTFVDPEMPISQKSVELTGIHDSDVKGAPTQESAVWAFLKFANGRPLAAHNATFDIGFIAEACKRYSIPFTPVFIDTYPLAQAMLPPQKNYKLDTVANFVGLPDFNHHRAADDAATAGLILRDFFRTLSAEGINSLSQINAAIGERRRSALETHRFRAQHIILLAKNQTGLRNLYKLITKSHLEHFKRYPTIPKSLLTELREGLIVGSACSSGEVFSLISDHRSNDELVRIAQFYDYFEIQPICNNMYLLEGNSPAASCIEDLKDFNRRVIALGRELGKPVVATGDVHFLNPEDEIYRHVLLSAKDFENGDRELPVYFRTTDEMLAEFDYLDSRTAYEVVIENPNKIADMCDNVRPLPPAKKLFPPKIENSADELKALVYNRLDALYGENPPDIVKNRVETELHDILSRNYDVIYMSAQKLVANSMEHGYLVGSRGSVGSSMVAYFAGITEVNSLPPHYRCPKCKHCDFDIDVKYGCGADMPDAVCPVCGAEYAKEGFNIPFETFLGFGGDKVPDIDLNFSSEYQANAHKYTAELFGADHVFRAGTIGTIAEKTGYGYVKKYMEKVCKTVPRPEETRLALGLVGVKRTTGQHPGGLVVIPQDMEIYDFCPVQHPADDPDKAIITTHLEYHCMEDNLLKLDELGHVDPTMIKLLEDMTGVKATDIKLGEKETMQLFRTAEAIGLKDGDPVIGNTGSLGVPEFGTPFTRQMLCDTHPDGFEMLVRLSGFSHGTNVWAGNARELLLSGTATLRETVGCRDDIMLFLISKGIPEKRAFKIMESVRKGRGLPEGAEDEMRQAGVADWYIDSCKKIKYLFPKAHAVAYVTMGFRIAWFKVHYPLAFYTAYFSLHGEALDYDSAVGGLELARRNYKRIIDLDKEATKKELDTADILALIIEMFMRGIEFLPANIFKSDAKRFVIEDGKIRIPFAAISGIGAAAADTIAEAAKKGYFTVEEFSNLGGLSPSIIETLKGYNVFGDMPESNQLTLF